MSWSAEDPPGQAREPVDSHGGVSLPDLPLVPHTLADPNAGSPAAETPSWDGSERREYPSKREEMLQDLVVYARRLSSTLDRDILVGYLLESAIELVGGETGSVMLYDRYEQSLWIAKAVGLTESVVRSTVVGMGEGIAGWVAQTQKGQVINDAGEAGAAKRSGRRVQSAVSVPMVGPDGRLYGVVNVGSSKPDTRFADDDVGKLTMLAEQAALAMRNADELEESRRLFLDTLRALVVALETKDPYARGHTEHVTRYAVLLAREVGMEEEEVRRVELAALLHDIGRPAAGEAMLVSGRPLTAVEQTLIKMHPTVAAHVLKEAPDLADVVPMIYHHHERYDGSGYLGGVAGEDIPLGARILSIADAFEAITSDRPHRKARSVKAALDELRKGAGTQFDPRLVDAFVKMIERDPQVTG